MKLRFCTSVFLLEREEKRDWGIWERCGRKEKIKGEFWGKIESLISGEFNLIQFNLIKGKIERGRRG